MSDENLSWKMQLDDTFSGPASKMDRALQGLENSIKADASAKLERGLQLAGKAADSARAKVEALARANDAAAAKAAAALAAEDRAFSSRFGGKTASGPINLTERMLAGKMGAGVRQPKASAGDIAGFSMTLPGAEAKLSGFSKLVQGVGDTFGPKAASSLIRMGSAFERIAPAAQKAMGAVKGFATGAAGLAGGALAIGGTIGAGAVALTAAGGSWALKTLAFKEDSLQAFKVMTGTEASAERVFKRAAKFAADTPFSTEEVVGTYQKFLTAGFKENELDKLMNAVGDVGANMGTDKMAQVQTAIGQVKAKGKLQGEEMMQLAEAGVGQTAVLDALAKSTGKSKDQVQKLLSAGKITSQQGIDAILEAIRKTQSGGTLGGAMAGKSKTLTGLWSSVQDIPAGLMMDANTQKAMDPIKGIMSGLLKSFASDGPLYAKSIAMIERVSAAWGKAAGVMGGGALDTTISAAIDAIGNFGASMAPLAEGFLPEAAKQLADLFGGGNAADLKEAGKELAQIMGATATAAVATKDAFVWLFDEVEGFLDLIDMVDKANDKDRSGERFADENAKRGGKWGAGEVEAWDYQDKMSHRSLTDIVTDVFSPEYYEQAFAHSKYFGDGASGTNSMSVAPETAASFFGWGHGGAGAGMGGMADQSRHMSATIAPGAIVVQVGPDGQGAGEQVAGGLGAQLVNTFGSFALEAGG